MYVHSNGCVIIDEHDIGKTDIQLLTDLIYETNKIRVPEDKIKYGVPSDLDTRPDKKYDHNTFVPFKIDIDWNYHLARQTGFVYRRRNFADYFEGIEFTVEIDHFPFHVVDLLPQINEHLPFPLKPEDIQDYIFDERDTFTFDLIANPKSYIWTGRTKITMEPINPVFFQLVPNPFLPGFVQYVNP